ncbi:hypothetical protein IGS73_17490 [Janibacter indicus]|uniref:Antitoxin Xre/MbcA/ParS-like toxin-binding domain-containing protein n=1 Tax=Janibacter indicus TaxID=857417 RepID=A0A7L9J266_9MICO|nr:hypothetical protein [Janibacter indicus]QOK22800.1 hypothetical protein IGS73_17490 [Janibacter indicus]
MSWTQWQPCEAPMLYGVARCAQPSGHRGAHQLEDGTEYFTSDYDTGAACEAIRQGEINRERRLNAEAFQPSGMNVLIGPVHTTRAVMNLMGISRSTVIKRSKDGQVLTIKVKGRNLFPAFQFDDDQVRPDILKIVDALRQCADPTTIALWLQTPIADDAKARTPLAALNAGRHRVALNAARRAAGRWSASQLPAMARGG